MPRQYQLLHTLSKSLFIDRDFKCVVIVSKTPYLTALIACHGAKVEIEAPYAPGTCLLLPSNDDTNKFVHAVLVDTEYIGDQKYYWYKYRKIRSNSVSEPVSYAKLCTYVEEHGRIFPHKTAQDWLGKHDIALDDLNFLTNSSYPAIIGHDAKAKIDYWKKVPLGMQAAPTLNMERVLNLFCQNNALSNLNICSPRSFNPKKSESQIWVNEVPDNIERGRFMIILSPIHKRFMELISQCNNIYAVNRLSPVNSHNIPSHLIELGITSRTLLVGTLMREPSS